MAMLNNFFISRLLCFVFFALTAVITLSASSSYAQQCTPPYEMITKLHHPDPGAYTIWDGVYGNDDDDEVLSSVVQDGNDVLAVGEVRSFAKSKPSLVFVRFDHRGREVFEKHYKVSGLRKVVKILAHDDGYLVMANKVEANARNVVWLGFFDKDLNVRSQKIVKDNSFDLSATDITSSADNSGFAISVTTEKKIGEGKDSVIRKNASVYLLDEKGNELSSRGYFLGIDNEILSLSVSKSKAGKSGYIATGYFENQSGKDIGWVLRLDDNLSLIWQKEHSRGLSANLNSSSDYDDRSVAVLGDVTLANSSLKGSWLMMLDKESGDIIWQRYYYGETGHHNYVGRDVNVNKDGLIDVVMMAESTLGMPDISVSDDAHEVGDLDADVPENMSYAHHLVLSPRGITMSGEAYYYGRGVSVSQMVESDNGNKLLVGSSVVRVKNKVVDDAGGNDDNVKTPLKDYDGVNLPDVDLSDKAKAGLAMLKNKFKNHDELGLADKSDDHDMGHNKESDNKNSKGNVVTRNGWVVVGNSSDAYTDPCK